MKCSHKPKEIMKAIFTFDNVFKCKKCGKDIWYKNDRWDYWHETRIVSILVVVLSGALGTLIGVFTSKEVGLYAVLALLVFLHVLGMWIYVMVYAEFVSSEDEEEKAGESG